VQSLHNELGRQVMPLGKLERGAIIRSIKDKLYVAEARAVWRTGALSST